jgi:hypothetical protein
VLTGADVMALTSSLVVGVKAPLECWPIAVDRVRYVVSRSRSSLHPTVTAPKTPLI